MELLGYPVIVKKDIDYCEPIGTPRFLSWEQYAEFCRLRSLYGIDMATYCKQLQKMEEDAV